MPSWPAKRRLVNNNKRQASRKVDRNDSSRRDLTNRQLGILEWTTGLQPVATALDKGVLEWTTGSDNSGPAHLQADLE